MKSIVSKEKLPKFLMVNKKAEQQSFNKYLLKPYRNGELVKVAPFEEQVRNSDYDHLFEYVKPNNDPLRFKKNFVKIIRKDENGKWSLTYIASWEIFDLLTKNKIKK